MLVQQPPVFKLARWHSFYGAFRVYVYYEAPVREGLSDICHEANAGIL